MATEAPTQLSMKQQIWNSNLLSHRLQQAQLGEQKLAKRAVFTDSSQNK
jgi:hypothetical protein